MMIGHCGRYPATPIVETRIVGKVPAGHNELAVVISCPPEPATGARSERIVSAIPLFFLPKSEFNSGSRGVHDL